MEPREFLSFSTYSTCLLSFNSSPLTLLHLLLYLFLPIPLVFSHSTFLHLLPHLFLPISLVLPHSTPLILPHLPPPPASPLPYKATHCPSHCIDYDGGDAVMGQDGVIVVRDERVIMM